MSAMVKKTIVWVRHAFVRGTDGGADIFRIKYLSPIGEIHIHHGDMKAGRHCSKGKEDEYIR
jgi:hypothetical protein